MRYVEHTIRKCLFIGDKVPGCIAALYDAIIVIEKYRGHRVLCASRNRASTCWKMSVWNEQLFLLHEFRNFQRILTHYITYEEIGVETMQDALINPLAIIQLSKLRGKPE